MFTFNYNRAYKLIESEGRHLIVKEVNGKVFHFDPMTFKYLGDDGVRYIPSTVREGYET